LHCRLFDPTILSNDSLAGSNPIRNSPAALIVRVD